MSLTTFEAMWQKFCDRDPLNTDLERLKTAHEIEALLDGPDDEEAA